jgi:hypothetical protein
MLKNSLFLVFIGVALILLSCKKEKEDSGDPALNATFNNESAEKNKQLLEDNSIELVQGMSDIKEMNATKVAVNLGSMMDKLPVNSSAMSMALIPEKILTNPESASTMLKSATTDPQNLVEAWDMVVGTYNYNQTTGEFDKTEGGSEIIINFPGMETDITNTAQIKVNNFNYMTVTEPYILNNQTIRTLVGQKFPTSLYSELSYNSTILATWNFSASFQSNGMPTSLSSILTVAPYSLSVIMTHSPYTNATSTFSFKKGTIILIETHTEANGNWSEANIKANAQEETFENIINNANAYIQILDMKVAGLVDIKAAAPEVRILEDKKKNETITEQAFAEQMVDLINANAKLVVVSASDNVLICKVQVYAYHNTELDYWEPALQFIFGDQSVVDAETYISSGAYKVEFGGLIDEITAMMNELEADFGGNQ